MRIGVTTCGYDAVKDRPQERSGPESGMKSQGFDFSREGEKMSRMAGSMFLVCRYQNLFCVFLRRGLHFPKVL